MAGEGKTDAEKEGNFNQFAYQNRYAAENYDKICLIIPKGKKATIKEAAEEEGKSMSSYILEAVEEKMERK